jgi:hypothetical protein
MRQTIYSEIAEKAERKRLLCEKYSSRYLPKGEIELLIVGESPPISDTYFYIPADLRRRHQGLPAKIFRSLFGASTKIDRDECVQFLEKFQRHNFLLTDIVAYPIDCLVPPLRAKAIVSSISEFKTRVNFLDLADSCSKIMILPFGTYKELQIRRYNGIREIFEQLGFKITKWGQIEAVFYKISRELKAKRFITLTYTRTETPRRRIRYFL